MGREIVIPPINTTMGNTTMGKWIMRRLLGFFGVLVTAMVALAPAAAACGFLVSANGSVKLLKTTTFVAWEDGIERYITNFAFEGDAEAFGTLIPLPAEPTDVQRAGDWTLQRLVREVSPPVDRELAAPALDFLAAEGGRVEVILETKIDSLEVIVLKGGGQDVLAWVNDNGFNLPEGPETDHMLAYYGDRSPYFLAARFDADAAAADDFQSGDGIPVQITIPIDRPWVPLHILHGATPDQQVIEADVFLLTPDEPRLLYGAGLNTVRSEPANDLLLDDLRSDQNMEWIPDSGWFTYLELDTKAGNLTYDLAISVDGSQPSAVDAGLTMVAAGSGSVHPSLTATLPDDSPDWTAVGFVLAGMVVLVGAAGAVGLTARRAG
ncbi:MAG: DUF2330 domain-containing protein [Acidimicrobiales bacterium]|nr:DUF2330 domain-containing protein [Acidimicrobiales bacterium]